MHFVNVTKFWTFFVCFPCRYLIMFEMKFPQYKLVITFRMVVYKRHSNYTFHGILFGHLCYNPLEYYCCVGNRSWQIKT